jgi:hypothetical protein
MAEVVWAEKTQITESKNFGGRIRTIYIEFLIIF